MDTGHFEINLFSQGTQADTGWTASLPGLEINYGALPNLQLHVIFQQGLSAPAGGGTGITLGNVELGAKYRFLTPGDDDWYPQAGIFPMIEIPAGNPRLGLTTGHAQVYLPLWLQKDFGNWTLFGGGGYWINPGPGNSNYGFFGLGLLRQLFKNLALGVELFHQTPTGRTALSPVGSVGGLGTASQTAFNAGAVYDFSDHWHLLMSAGSGVQNRNATNALSYYAALQLTF